MKKTILLTGATDGIGLETAKILVAEGHHLLIHGRSAAKLSAVEKALTEIDGHGQVQGYVADLSRLEEVEALADAVSQEHQQLDVLINNAGVYSAATPVTGAGLDIRFVVNTIAPYLLTRRLLPLMGPGARVVNVSSAAQAPVDLEAFAGRRKLSDGAAYAQSKLAITAWSRHMALELGANGPVIVAVNPASMLGSKMVKDAYGVDGGDLRVGADIFVRAALSDEFADASGKYFDNDRGQFAAPHPDALDAEKPEQIVRAIEAVLEDIS